VSHAVIATRRILWIVLIGAVGGAAYAWWRDHRAVEPAGPAEWPPLPQPSADVADNDASAERTTSATPPADAAWVAPADDGSCPVGYPVKAKESSGIFHVDGGRFYERTRADRCYPSAAAAEADGYRQSKS
jgi:hypothetical protein